MRPTSENLDSLLRLENMDKVAEAETSMPRLKPWCRGLHHSHLSAVETGGPCSLDDAGGTGDRRLLRMQF